MGARMYVASQAWDSKTGRGWGAALTPFEDALKLSAVRHVHSLAGPMRLHGAMLRAVTLCALWASEKAHPTPTSPEEAAAHTVSAVQLQRLSVLTQTAGQEQLVLCEKKPLVRTGHHLLAEKSP